MGNKRKVSILIPYKIRKGNTLVFLQKRSKDAKRLPDYFGFFGGGAEGNENPEDALRREIKEELNYIPTGYRFLKKYDFTGSIKDIFFLEVSNDFEKEITVLEGDYGKWFSEREFEKEQKLIEEDKIVLRDLFKLLKNEK